MKKRIKSFGSILKKTANEWYAMDPFKQSAVIAYYAIFSLPALLVLIINVAGFFYEEEVISGEISRQVEGVMGFETAEQVEDMVQKASETEAGVVSGIIAAITIVFGATGVFVALQKALNQIWEVQQKPDAGLKAQLKSRLFSFGLILAIGFLLLMSLTVSTVLAAFSNWLKGVFPDVVAYLFFVAEFAISLSVISVMFALMFRYLPDVRLRWRALWPGAILTAGLFMLGKYGLSFYFGKAEPASVYGGAGSVVLLLLWASYSSMIVFFGAEFTHQYALFYEYEPRLTKLAIKVSETRMPSKDQDILIEKLKAKEKEVVQMEDKIEKQETKNEKGKMKNEEKPDRPAHRKTHKEEIQQADHEEKPYKFKSMKEVEEKIAELEMRLEDDKEGIVDNLKPSSIIAGIIPKGLRLKEKLSHHGSVDHYLRTIAKRHIKKNVREESFVDKIRKLIGLEKES